MDIESGASAAFVLGFLLGLKHATDADHVVAVSTIVNESRNPWQGLWIGGSWGLGHSTPLILLGIVILIFKGMVMNRYAELAPILEFGVGIMLVLLGVQVFWNLKHGRLHQHRHTHDDGPHVHIHATHHPTANPEVESRHSYFHFGKPAFRLKSYTIGAVHGLAGTAAVMLLLLPTLSSFWVGIGYLILFGIGTMMSMAAITLLLGIPFALSRSYNRINNLIAYGAGCISIVFGIALMSDITLSTAFIPF